MVEETTDSQSAGTLQSEAQLKFKQFTAWCRVNGIEYPGQEFPALFNDGKLIGVRTNKAIGYRKAFVKVPYRCIISVNKIREHKFLK